MALGFFVEMSGGEWLWFMGLEFRFGVFWSVFLCVFFWVWVGWRVVVVWSHGVWSGVCGQWVFFCDFVWVTGRSRGVAI